MRGRKPEAGPGPEVNLTRRFLSSDLQVEASQPRHALAGCLSHLLQEAVHSGVGDRGQVTSEAVAVLLLNTAGLYTD